MKWNLDNTYLALPQEFYQLQAPNPTPSPSTICINDALMSALGFESFEESSDLRVLSGNAVAPGSTPFAQAYSGHQFGHFTHLGDGRALLLGEQITPSGQRFDIQLKGSGKTSYSRRGDGKAALGPMLREYLISESMHALGIPTTRSLAVIGTGEPVFRETTLPGAILVRVAASHIRVGTFEFAASLNDKLKLKSLADYTIRRHYADLAETSEPYVELIRTVAKKQAQLVSKWMLFGFIHGVMNTDNMAVSGETIDYGPCAFMNAYDPETVFSSIDQYGRYAYGNQPSIALWNLERFAESLLPLLDASPAAAKEKAIEALKDFETEFHEAWLTGMGRKMGLQKVAKSDLPLMGQFLELLKAHRADFTRSFRELGSVKPEGELFRTAEFQSWHPLWLARLAQESAPLESIRAGMEAVNPALIPRNHRVEEAIASAHAGDLSPFRRLLRACSSPFHPDVEFKDLLIPPSIKEQEGYQTFCGT